MVSLSQGRWQNLRHWAVIHRTQIALLFLGILVPLILFGAFAEDVWNREDLRFDNPIQLWAHSYATPRLDAWMLAFTRLGTPGVMVLLCLFITGALWYRRRHGDSIFVFLSVGGAGVLNVGTKLVFGRDRPDLWVSIDPRTDYSFPSGHAMASMALYVAILLLVWKTPARVVFLVAGALVVLCVGLSRIYLGVHYPSDVLGGWLASLAWVLGLHFIRQLRQQTTYLSTTLKRTLSVSDGS